MRPCVRVVTVRDFMLKSTLKKEFHRVLKSLKKVPKRGPKESSREHTPEYTTEHTCVSIELDVIISSINTQSYISHIHTFAMYVKK